MLLALAGFIATSHLAVDRRAGRLEAELARLNATFEERERNQADWLASRHRSVLQIGTEVEGLALRLVEIESSLAEFSATTTRLQLATGELAEKITRGDADTLEKARREALERFDQGIRSIGELRTELAALREASRQAPAVSSEAPPSNEAPAAFALPSPQAIGPLRFPLEPPAKP